MVTHLGLRYAVGLTNCVYEAQKLGLSDDDKRRIEEEERYRKEVRDRLAKTAAEPKRR